MSNTHQQSQAIQQAVNSQASSIQEVLTQQGKALIDAMAQQALQQAQAAAMGELAVHAQQRLSEMAATTAAELQGLTQLEPVEITTPEVLALKPVPIALPTNSSLSLPQSVRMGQAALPAATKPSASAKRRQRRKKASEAQEI